MPLDNLFEKTLVNEYNALSQQLRVAADYVVANPIDVATRSLRAISASSGLAPATFSRLARALGFNSYEELKELARAEVHQQVNSFSVKASQLQKEEKAHGKPPFLTRQSQACVSNISALSKTVSASDLEAAVETMHKADRVLVLGALGSAGIVEYMSYLANFYTNKFRAASCVGASMGSALADLGKQDAILVLTKPPFARSAIQAAQMANEQGAYVVVITDSASCPALKYADTDFIINSDSPQFFSSYAATIVLIETMIGMLVARAGPAGQRHIKEVEARNHRLEEFWG